MYRNLLLFAILILTGCATNEAYNYGEFQSPLNSNMSFYSQTEIVFTHNKHIIAAPFLSDHNDYLPDNIIKLHLGLLIQNPDKTQFVIWAYYRLTDIDNPEKTYNMSRVVVIPHALPEGFVSIDMPFQTNIHSQIDFSVSVLSENQLLYKSTLIRYKTKGVIN